MSTNLESKREGRLLHLTLNHPANRNALRVSVCRQIVALLNEAELDPGIGAILIDATGPDFCSGIDLRESLADDTPERAAIHNELFSLGERISKPIITAVQGRALAAGLGLVANSHLVVATEDSGFSLPEIRLGLWPFVVFPSVAAAIGERRALELSLTGRVIDAAEALQWGLVHYVVPASKLKATAYSIADSVSRYSPEAIRRGLEVVQRSRSLSRAEAVDLADAMRGRALASADFAEGVDAFFNRRTPVWPSGDSS